jgi:hypothetical protein
VNGPWKAEYGLGAYGVDTAAQTVWAVLDYNSNFAAATFGSSCGTAAHAQASALK